MDLIVRPSPSGRGTDCPATSANEQTSADVGYHVAAEVGHYSGLNQQGPLGGGVSRVHEAGAPLRRSEGGHSLNTHNHPPHLHTISPSPTAAAYREGYSSAPTPSSAAAYSETCSPDQEEIKSGCCVII